MHKGMLQGKCHPESFIDTALSQCQGCVCAKLRPEATA